MVQFKRFQTIQVHAEHVVYVLSYERLGSYDLPRLEMKKTTKNVILYQEGS